MGYASIDQMNHIMVSLVHYLIMPGVSNVGVTNIYYNVMGFAGSLVGYAFDRSQISNTFSSGLIHTQLETGYISSHARMEDGEMSNSFSFASAKGGYTVEFSNGSTVNSYYRGYINDVLATSQWLSSNGNKVTITDHELKTNWPSWGVNNGTTYPRFNWIDFDPQADTSFSPIDFMAIEENQPAGTMITQFKHTYPDANVTLTYSLDDPDGNTSNHLFVLDGNGTLKSSISFNYENNSSYIVGVRASNDQNQSYFRRFRVEVLNIDEPPTGDLFITGSPFAGGTMSISKHFSDPDGIVGDITYHWNYEDRISNRYFLNYIDDNISALDGANSVTLSSDGKHAYVTGSSGDAVSWYERNASTGALSYGGMLKDGVNGVDGLDGANSVTLSSDGNHAYVTGYIDNAVSWYERNASTGALTYGGMLKDGSGWSGRLEMVPSVAGVTLSSDGNHAYVTGICE